jgi:hypothetical protein
MASDRNSANSQRLRRNAQRAVHGDSTSYVKVANPLLNTGTQIQITFLPAGGLTSTSGAMTIKLDPSGNASLSLSNAGLAFQYPVTTKGDLLGFSTVPTRVPVSATNGQVLTASSGVSTGLGWTTPFSATNLVFSEVPTATATNTVYYLANTSQANTVQAYKAGMRLTPTTDYTASGSVITYAIAPVGTILVDYLR